MSEHIVSEVAGDLGIGFHFRQRARLRQRLAILLEIFKIELHRLRRVTQRFV
jgi:hypothetical protein